MTNNADDLPMSNVTPTWQDILAYERKEIEIGRAEVRLLEKPLEQPEPHFENNAHDLVGLAFSGGGIRSATFNLGVIQALAELRLLRKIDYLSTVSGGGYIGSWLTSWIASHDQSAPHDQSDPKASKESNSATKLQSEVNDTNTDKSVTQNINTETARFKILANVQKMTQNIWKSQARKDEKTRNIIEIENALAPLDINQKPALASGSDEPDALRHLRSYTDYLKPHGGLFSLDSMTAFTTWLRNSFLNQFILVAILSFLLMLPFVLGSLVKNIIYTVPIATGEMGLIEEIIPFASNSGLWILVPFLLACATGFINLNILYKPTLENPKLPWYSSQKSVLLFIILPLLLFSLLMTMMLPSLHQIITEIGINGIFHSAFEISLWPLTPSAMIYWMFISCGIAFIISSPLRMIFFQEHQSQT